MAVSRSGSACMPGNCWGKGTNPYGQQDVVAQYTGYEPGYNDAGKHRQWTHLIGFRGRKRRSSILSWNSMIFARVLHRPGLLSRPWTVSENHEATISLEQGMVRPLIEDDREFNGIWRFHREMIIPDPSAHIPMLKCTTPLCGTAKKQGESPWNRKCLNLYLPGWRTPARYLTGANGRAAGS